MRATAYYRPAARRDGVTGLQIPSSKSQIPTTPNSQIPRETANSQIPGAIPNRADTGWVFGIWDNLGFTFGPWKLGVVGIWDLELGI